MVYSRPMVPRSSDWIALGDFLRLHRLASSGGQAKILIQSGKVRVNGETDLRRARKLRAGDRVQVESGPEHVVTLSDDT